VAKRKLTRKQILAGFGGRRRQQLAKPGAARRKSGASYAKRTKRRTTKRASKKTGMPAWAKGAVAAALTAALLIGGAKLNTFVKQRGGWAAAKLAYNEGGIPGVVMWAQSAPVVAPVLAAPAYRPPSTPLASPFTTAAGALGGFFGGIAGAAQQGWNKANPAPVNPALFGPVYGPVTPQERARIEEDFARRQAAADSANDAAYYDTLARGGTEEQAGLASLISQEGELIASM